MLQKDLADQVWDISVAHSSVREITGELWTGHKKTKTNANVFSMHYIIECIIHGDVTKQRVFEF